MRALQDCQRENHELRVILEKIRVHLRIEGIDDFDKALGEIEENRVTAVKYISWVDHHKKILDSVIMQKEESEKSLRVELSSLMEKLEKSQQELAIFKSGENSSSHQSTDLSWKLSLANDELLRVKTEAERYKEVMEARYALLKRRKKAQLINTDREAQRLCNKVARDTSDLVTTENGLPTRKFPDVHVPPDEVVEFGSSDEDEISDGEEEFEEEDADGENVEGEFEDEFLGDVRKNGADQADKAVVNDAEGDHQPSRAARKRQQVHVLSSQGGALDSS